METMRDILEEIVARTGLSARGFDRAATARGQSVSYTTISKILNGQHSGDFSPAVLAAIAAVGQIPLQRVYAAAGQPLPGRPLADELPPGANALGFESRKVVIDLVRHLVALERLATPAESEARGRLHLAADNQAEQLEDDQDDHGYTP